jgi:hypothetical protein
MNTWRHGPLEKEVCDDDDAQKTDGVRVGGWVRRLASREPVCNVAASCATLGDVGHAGGKIERVRHRVSTGADGVTKAKSAQRTDYLSAGAPGGVWTGARGVWRKMEEGRCRDLCSRAF